MRTACLRIASICLHLHRVDQVRELDRVLDEEDWDIVADQIPIALLRIEFDRKASRGVSTEPAPPATVEKRVNTGTLAPGRWNRSAFVMPVSDSYSSK
jgi:hypothetical protein